MNFLRLTTSLILLGFACAVTRLDAAGQDPFPRIMVQDSALDNLVGPAGEVTVPAGSLGRVTRVGSGPGRMILIPGLGLGGEVFAPLMDRLAGEYSMWAVTLAGFGGTPPQPSPPAGTSYSEQTWTDGALRGIEGLLEGEDLDSVVVVGHWLTGSSLALRLAARHPDRVRAVILIAGSAGFAFRPMTLDERRATMDGPLSQRWFRTVTRETWDDNNFLPGDYAIHPVLGLRLWREAARPPLHVWIRYLLELYAQDPAHALDGVGVPVTILFPDFAGVWHDPTNFYQSTYTVGSWGDLAGRGVSTVTIPATRVVMWADAPDAVVEALRAGIDAASRSGGDG